MSVWTASVKCLITFQNPDFKLQKTKLIHSLSCFWTTNWKSSRKSLPPTSAGAPRWCNRFPNIACCWWPRRRPIGRAGCRSRDVTARSRYYCKQPACSPPTLCAEPTTPSGPLFVQRKHRRGKARRPSAPSRGPKPKSAVRHTTPPPKKNEDATSNFNQSVAPPLMFGDVFCWPAGASRDRRRLVRAAALE